MKHIRVKNSLNQHKGVKLGFSWTMFFFGFFVPLFRGDFVWTAIIIIGSAFLGLIGLGGVVPFLSLGLSFVYNKIYARDLHSKGFRGLTEEEDRAFTHYIRS